MRSYFGGRIRVLAGYAATLEPTVNRWHSPGSTGQRRREQRIQARSFDDDIVTLQPGTIVVHDRAPYRVVEIREVPRDFWEEKEPSLLDEINPFRYPKDTPPVDVTIRPERGGKPVVLRASSLHRWDVLPEHYAVCHACGELPPCSHELKQERIAKQMAVAAELMSIPAGNCLSCGEGITGRQKAVRFPGPNLWRPDLPEGTAMFHGCKECAHSVEKYAKQFKKHTGKELPAKPSTPLHRTPARQAWLQAIADGQVTTHVTVTHDASHLGPDMQITETYLAIYPRHPAGTLANNWLGEPEIRALWIARDAGDEYNQPVELTEAGKQLLATWGGEQ